MKLLLTSIVVIFSAIIIYFFVLGYISKKGQPLGLVDSKLAPCSQKPNCVCSEYPADLTHYVQPLDVVVDAANVKNTPALVMATVKKAVIEAGGKLQPVSTSEKDYYLAATFKSSLFGFIDDVEMRFDIEGRKLHLRSASRVGRSDFGMNRKRMKKLSESITRRLR
ncbi:DUF1499 domain-containing protein [Neptunomonas antarctica]|uniref:Uncharacterized conserved protein, DUF1499 family n=1 Tax=Neptunomonas antarctica TaxID=619304 RepID=A0A1N7P3P3_9GAMM|nr:DUF1499 domain-containing protein [Neptunomonas antarctica]SIT05059.1 Uncharacterized conserved protein, DUF1499 family [Neptunomonas antarctica]